MKKVLVGFILILLIVSISFPNTTHAATTTAPHILITPNSIFYDLKIFGEWAAQNIISLGGIRKQAKMDYILKRETNRAVEILAMDADPNGDTNSSGYIEAMNIYLSLQKEYNNLLKGIEQSQRLEMAKKEISAMGPCVDELGAKPCYGSMIVQKMDDVRKQILTAQDAGDDTKMASLTGTLKDLQKNYKDAEIISGSVNSLEKQELEQAQSTLVGADKLNYALAWANKYKQDVENTSKNEAYQGNSDLFNNAQKALDNLISDLKSIPLDKVDDKKLDSLFGGTRQVLNDTARAISLKNVIPNTFNQPPSEKATQTAPAIVPVQKNKVVPQQVEQPKVKPEVKPVLKKIPSTNVSTTLPVVLGGTILNGKVGEYFSFQYSAQDGLPPYHFNLEPGYGFPPIGLILDANGLLSGTPSAEGTSHFEVCAVDSAAHGGCTDVTMTIAKGNITPPPTPELHISITSNNCQKNVDKSGYSNSHSLQMSGTASGPVGTNLGVPNGKEGSRPTCGSWTANAWGTCTREAGQPEQTQWSISNSEELWPIGVQFNGPYDMSVWYTDSSNHISMVDFGYDECSTTGSK